MSPITNNTLRKLTCLAVLALLLTVGCNQNTDENSTKNMESEIEPTLQMAVEDLNQLLPQHLGSNTSFDSIGVTPNRVYYYYSIDNISKQDFENENLSDSLYTASNERVPCSLWRPRYMQGVEVTFTYYSNDKQELIQFSRVQKACE